MGAPANATVTATLYGEYYIVNISTEYTHDGSTFTDESSCCVDLTTGDVFNQIG